MLLAHVSLSPAPAVGYGSWFEHVQEFWEHRTDSNVLFLKYEDMHRVSLEPFLALRGLACSHSLPGTPRRHMPPPCRHPCANPHIHKHPIYNPLGI